MAQILALALLPIAMGIALIGAYLVMLTVAAALYRPRPLRSPERRTFAVLVPAHDEARVIGGPREETLGNGHLRHGGERIVGWNESALDHMTSGGPHVAR